MNCIQKQQLVSFPKVRIWKPWFRHFNNHKEFHNEGTVHLFSLMALFSYANFRSNERMISGARYMEAPGQWICKLGSLPRILRVHSKRQALEQLDYYEKYGFLTYEWLDEENEIIRFSITNWKEHCTSLQYNYYSYKGSGFFFFPLPVGRMLLRIAHKTEGIVFSELDAIITEMAEFLLFLLDEREKLSAAIHQAKVSLPLGAGLDGEVSLNGKRQEIATLLRHMAGLRNGEVLISNGGVGYRFNNEGNQVSYRCDVKRVTTINFDRNKIRKMCADLSKKSDETSAALDAALVNTPVEYEAPFDVNETFAEAFEAHMSALS